MTVAVGTTVTAASPNTSTNTSLPVPLATTTVGQLNVIEISGFANGTTINPGMTTPAGWTKLLERLDTNGTPASFVAVYYRIFQTGDPTSVTISWTTAGNMVALCTAHSAVDTTTALPWSTSDFKVPSDVNYSIAGTTGAAGTLCYGFANRTGTAWSGLSDTTRGQVTNASSSTMIGQVVAGDTASGTAFTKTAVGSNTSVGVSWAYVIKPAVAAPPPPSTPIDIWLAATPFICAHRGGSDSWPEMTLFAYQQAVEWGATALELSLWRTSDGIWVGSHDKSTLRVFGVDYDITQTTWATLQTLRTTVGGYPMCRAEEVLDRWGSTRIIFVDNKQGVNVTAFFDKLDTYAGSKGRFVIKSYYTDVNTPAEAHNRGYKTWGYYYQADVPNLASTQSRWDILGMDYLADQASWTAVLSYGKPVMGHIINSAAARTTALGFGAQGLMVSNFKAAVTYNPPARKRSRWNGTTLVDSVRSRAPFDPNWVPGLANYWNPNSLAAADGSAVSSLPAIIGGAALTSGTAARQPVLATTSKGNRLVRFTPDGTAANDDELLATITALAQPVTLAVVHSIGAAATQEIIQAGVEVLTSTTALQAFAGTTISKTMTLPDALGITVVVFNGSTSKLYRNGGAPLVANAGATGLSTSFRVGRHGSSGRPLTGDVGAICVYAGALTQAQVETLGRGLGSLYPTATPWVTATA